MATVELSGQLLTGVSCRCPSEGETLSRFDPQGFFFSDNNRRRPFYHASDEGLPIIALLNYLSVDDLYRQQIITLLSQWKERQLSLNPLETNPFRYMRLTWTPFDTSAGSVNNQGGNLAAGKTLTASSTEAGHPVTDAVDGSLNTRWEHALQ